MKKKWNWSLWVGFLLALTGFASFYYFVRFPSTRDFPWVNLLIFAAAGICLGLGLRRAFSQPDVYRGKISGPVLSVLSLGVFALFTYGLFFVARQLPAAAGAPRVGQKVPDFTLPDQDGKPVSLANLVSSGGKGAVLIFYRGYW